jgi:ADP-ribosylglycohydrolase
MLGAICGDVIGSVHEWTSTKTKEFPLFVPASTFTDDSVLTFAVADWILSGDDLTGLFHSYFHAYPGRGYGGFFMGWATRKDRMPYQSYGNGAAMRVSPVGFAFDTLEEVLEWGERSAAPTHDHAEGIRGAQATAAAIFLARKGRTKEEIRTGIASRFGYDVDARLDDIRPTYRFNETCQGTVPQAIIAFAESTSWEDAVRNAISLGGDADTLACITGAIAEAHYGGVPRHVSRPVLSVLDRRLNGILERFRQRFALAPS